MPELPEVEAARRFIEKLCAGSTIVSVTTRELGGGPREGSFDDIVFEHVSGGTTSESLYHSALLHKTLKRVHRKGKQFWFEFAEPESPCVLFHFGMTGSCAIKGQEAMKYRSFKVNEAHWPPRFTKLLLKFDNGEELAFCDPRRLGRIKIRSDPQNTSPLKDLGIDPLNGDIPDVPTLKKLLNSISSPIKSLLLDQERVFCGIGNYLADEILYQAKIHPSTKANALSDAGVEALTTAVKYVIHTAVAAEADYKLFPTDWLFHCRWDKVKSKSQKILLPNGSAVVFEEVAGRTTAIVPSVQLLRSSLVTLSATSTVQKKTKVVAGSSLADTVSNSTAAGETTLAKKKRKTSRMEVKVEVKEELREEVKVMSAQKGKRKIKEEEGGTARASRKSPRLT